MADFYNPTLDEIRDAYLRDLRIEIPDAVTIEGSDYYVDATILA